MKKALLLEIPLLFLLSLLFAFGNNSRNNVSLEWFYPWTPLSELNKHPVPVESEFEDISDWENLDPTELMNAVDLFLQENEGKGPTFLGSKRAQKIHEVAFEKTLWIDARSQELYDRGHIRGAVVLHFYEPARYFPEVQSKIQQQQPISLILYCRGKDCTDSKLLAQKFEEWGYRNLFIYVGGYEQWETEGYPIDVNLQDTKAPKVPESKPVGMYLEHLILDLFPFFLGLFFLIAWKNWKNTRLTLWIAIGTVGFFFLYASVPKILNPIVFAKNIWNYDLVPGHWTNAMALVLPILEALLAFCLIVGIFRKSAGSLICVLLLVYVTAVSANMIRGHEFQCGCFAEKTWITHVYLEGWNDKITLLLRDFGLFVMSFFICYSQKPKQD